MPRASVSQKKYGSVYRIRAVRQGTDTPTYRATGLPGCRAAGLLVIIRVRLLNSRRVDPKSDEISG